MRGKVWRVVAMAAATVLIAGSQLAAPSAEQWALFIFLALGSALLRAAERGADRDDIKWGLLADAWREEYRLARMKKVA